MENSVCRLNAFFNKYSVIYITYKHIILCSVDWLLPGGQVLPAVDAWFSREGFPARWGRAGTGKQAGGAPRPEYGTHL